MARCPECSALVLQTEDLELWDHIFCPICDTELEIISLSPLAFEAVYDFDDEEDDLLLADIEELDWEEDSW